MIRVMLTDHWLAGFILNLALVSGAMADSPARTIEVAGEHQQMVAADQYEISVDLIVRSQHREDLQQQMAQKRTVMHALVKRFQLASKDVGYTRADLREEFKWQNNERKQVGYSLQESWWLKVANHEINRMFLTALADTDSVDAYRSQPQASGKQMYRQALAFALSDAEQKARLMVQELGGCLGKPLTITEVAGHGVPQPMMMRSTLSTGDALPEAKVSSQAKVHVVWRIKDC